MAESKLIASIADDVFALLISSSGSYSDWQPSWDKDRHSPFFDEVERVARVEKVVAALNPRRDSSMEGAFYNPELDLINVPPTYSYRNSLTGETATQSYYHSLFHELSHWTGHQQRLARLRRPGIGFSMPAYAREELVAEASALILMRYFGLAPPNSSRHVAYFQLWWERAGNKERALRFARKEAERAVQYILEEASAKGSSVL
jgi:antirestriction protein ArdC